MRSSILAMKLDTEAIINEVHLRDVLWNKTSPQYKNRDARLAAWHEISLILNPKYEELNEEDRQMFDQRVQKRWRTARDAYSKAKLHQDQPSRSGRIKRKKYIYFKILSFLDKTNTADEIEESISVPLDETNQSEQKNNVSEIEPQKPKTKMNKKRRTNLNSELFQNELAQDDLSFFKSLQPTLTSFTNYQKLLFRTRVLNVAIEIESQNYVYENPTPTSLYITDESQSQSSHSQTSNCDI